MKHIFQKGSTETLILLHGTGGDETDLIPLANMINKEASILSVRGNVLEQGLPRFFKRIAMGVFDMESLKNETVNLHDFIQKASKDYDFDLNKATIVGYSNGANIAISLLFTYNNPVQRAILLRPMIPTREIQSTSLKDTQVIIVSSKKDTIVPIEHGVWLEKTFKSLDAQTTFYTLDTGHGLTQEDVNIIRLSMKK